MCIRDSYYGYGYGLGLGLGLGALYYGAYGAGPYSYGYYDDDGYADAGPPVDEAGPPPDAAGPGPGGNSGAWYYCNNPDGYYPYVKHCNSAWQAVPPTPPPQNNGD